MWYSSDLFWLFRIAYVCFYFKCHHHFDCDEDIFKFIYPKPPKEFFAKEGDDTTVRTCDHCGHELATYRGILERNGSAERFFCNDEHRLAYLDGVQNKSTPSDDHARPN